MVQPVFSAEMLHLVASLCSQSTLYTSGFKHPCFHSAPQGANFIRYAYVGAGISMALGKGDGLICVMPAKKVAHCSLWPCL